jgi:hypothetical protein
LLAHDGSLGTAGLSLATTTSSVAQLVASNAVTTEKMADAPPVASARFIGQLRRVRSRKKCRV